MCDFCKNIKSDFPKWDFSYDEENDILPSGEAIELLFIHGYFALVFTNSADEYEYSHIRVDFCPICGRKLEEEKELPRVTVGMEDDCK